MTEEARRNFRLLVVEDNPINQKIVARALAKLGFATDISNHGLEALQALQSNRYALILMDCMMPEMDGYETTQAIRRMETGERTPIVAFTADNTSDCRIRCFEAGMDDYLTKPLDMGVLESTLERWICDDPT